MEGAFSGLDANRLLQRRGAGNFPNQKAESEDTQVSGQMSLRIPVAPHAGTVMNDLNAVFRLTHVGARTLERLLYAMDPHENNESIVSTTGTAEKRNTPLDRGGRSAREPVSNGRGVTVGGSNINLPPIKRLNVTGLPIQTRIQNLAVRLTPLVKGLKILSADNPSGGLAAPWNLRRNPHEKVPFLKVYVFCPAPVGFGRLYPGQGGCKCGERTYGPGKSGLGIL